MCSLFQSGDFIGEGFIVSISSSQIARSTLKLIEGASTVQNCNDFFFDVLYNRSVSIDSFVITCTEMIIKPIRHVRCNTTRGKQI